jgi:pimeloyl-ACP methyl ester carboxylesterase
MRFKLCAWPVLLLLLSATAGCGGFVARRMAQAPNSYPSWLAPDAPVQLAFEDNFLTNFPSRFVEVGPPPARLRYRIIEPADYAVKASSKNWTERGRPHFRFSFVATLPAATNAWTSSPRGTVVLLHGYGEGGFAMAPWSLRLAQEGWRCVQVDLRGHGKSTGPRIYFGVQETHDLSQLLDALAREHQLIPPVAAIGESYGAAMALRWKAVEPRVESVVAIAPYAGLSNAVLNICRQYAAWMPRALIRSGLKKLPSLLGVEAGQLDTTAVLAGTPVTALFVAGAQDKIAPPADVRALYEESAPGSKLLVVPGATHEAVAYFFNDLVPPVLAGLNPTNEEPKARARTAEPEVGGQGSARKEQTDAPGQVDRTN